MTKFSNGPAVGVVLSLARAPLFLRAVQNDAGTWDALDLLTDAPGEDETVVVYRKVEDRGMVHVCGVRDGKRWGGYYAHATYELHGEQPTPAQARQPDLWQDWAKAQAAKAKVPA